MDMIDCFRLCVNTKTVKILFCYFNFPDNMQKDPADTESFSVSARSLGAKHLYELDLFNASGHILIIHNEVIVAEFSCDTYARLALHTYALKKFI